MNVLIIGFGSIGSRYYRILTKKGVKVAVLSRRELKIVPCYKNLKNALSDEKPEIIIISNETSLHHETLVQCAQLNYKGIVLIEKPIFDKVKPIPKNDFQNMLVAYHLRFHPILKKLKKLLEGTRILSAQIYVGQYLPQWRENDYRNSYSSKSELGGGVLRDLSHELDLILWFFTGWKRLTSLGGKFSNLEIQSEDSFSIMLETVECPLVTVHMNYLDRLPRREIILNSVDNTFKADLINNQLLINNTIETYSIDKDDVYEVELEALMNKKFDSFCSAEESLEVLKIIDAAESANNNKKWVQL